MKFKVIMVSGSLLYWAIVFYVSRDFGEQTGDIWGVCMIIYVCIVIFVSAGKELLKKSNK